MKSSNIDQFNQLFYIVEEHKFIELLKLTVDFNNWDVFEAIESMDDLDVIEFIMLIEKEYNITVDDTVIDYINTDTNILKSLLKSINRDNILNELLN